MIRSALEAVGNSDVIACLLTPLVGKVVVSNPSRSCCVHHWVVRPQLADLAAIFVPPRGVERG